jgi:hypothetical protein
MEHLPIAALEQRDELTSSKSLRGVVTIIWPFSVSSRRAAFLLAEPDFRLRNDKGQVRIQFAGAAALELGKAHIGIGDEIVLGLAGARLVEREAGVVSTPGKSVSLELRFSSKLEMEVCKSSLNARGKHLRYVGIS